MTYDQQKRILDLFVASILIIAFLPFLERILPPDLVHGIETAVSTGKQIK